jgi:hypothetical protein
LRGLTVRVTGSCALCVGCEIGVGAVSAGAVRWTTTTRRASRRGAATRAARRLAARFAGPATAGFGAAWYGTLVSPTIAGSAGTTSGRAIGSAARVHSHAELVTDMPATETFAATATISSRRLIIGLSPP